MLKQEKVLYACEPDAQKALAAFLAEHGQVTHQLGGQVEPQVETGYRQRGRPKKGEAPTTSISYRVKLWIGEPTPERLRRLQELESTFILITNLFDEQKWPAKEILHEYKNQVSVELKFRLLKDPRILNGIYLKKPTRVEALAYVFVMAVLVATLLERKVRRALKSANDQVEVGGGILVQNPTAQALLDELVRLVVVTLTIDGQKAERMWMQTDPNAQKILKYAQVDLASFEKPWL